MNPDPRSSRLNIRFVLTRADARWAMENSDEAVHPERLDALIDAVETNVGKTAVERLELELANTRAMLGRLVTEIRGHWNPDRPAQPQARAALEDLRLLERYLLSLNETKIVKHRPGDREPSNSVGLQETPEKGVA